MKPLDVTPLEGRLAICRLGPTEALPRWAASDGFLSCTWTEDELSIVVREAAVPAETTCQRGWRALKVQGPLDFSQTGVLASLLAPLAASGVSVFAVSTFDTDYVLVPEARLRDAIEALLRAGHRLRR